MDDYFMHNDAVFRGELNIPRSLPIIMLPTSISDFKAFHSAHSSMRMITTNVERAVMLYMLAKEADPVPIGTSIEAVALLYGISESSLRRGMKAMMRGDEISRNGRPRYLSDEEEEILVTEVLEGQRLGDPLTVKQLRTRARELKAGPVRAG